MTASPAAVPLALACAATWFSAPLAGTLASRDEAFQNELVRAEMVADVENIAAGGAFRLAVRLSIAPGWHLNWLNPGDAGLAPSVEWSLPEGLAAAPVSWPFPRSHAAGPLVIFGYEGELLLVAEVSVAPDFAPGTPVTLGATVSWLACREACVPGEAMLSLSLPLAKSARAQARWRSAFDALAARYPAATADWRVESWFEDEDAIYIEMQTARPGTALLEGVVFFPYEQGVIENAEPQTLARVETSGRPGGYRLRVQRSRTVGATPPRLTGVLVSERGFDGGGAPSALVVDVPLEER
ncbi:MAG: protein-disulfide reductase DsbD family protein [Candidatus Krumholzibacteria bacterium]|nr:protein-disulfide reductase DsbD family protein [Candidatus Krumholzibacteria bacterium]